MQLHFEKISVFLQLTCQVFATSLKYNRAILSAFHFSTGI